MQTPHRLLGLALFCFGCQPLTPGSKLQSNGADTAPLGATARQTARGWDTTFRVWAPYAKAVSVAGDFNDWDPTANVLTLGSDGVWAGDVPEAAPGQGYKYQITPTSGSPYLRIDPRSLKVQNSAGNSLIYDPHAYQWQETTFTQPDFNRTVIYELHIGSFNVASGETHGTWQSAGARLDDLAALGVNMIEVMPVGEFPGDVSEGYNPSDIFAPSHVYGSPDDMKAFVDAAHAHGIGVMLDVVYNHWGPSDLPTWCFDGNCLGQGNGGVYFYTNGRQDTPWGNTRPDYGRQEVRDFITDNVRQWTEDYRVDGLRVDGTKYMRTIDGNRANEVTDAWGLMKTMNDTVHGAAPGKLMVAEDFGDQDQADAMTGSAVGFDAQWDGGFVHPLRDQVLNPPSDASRSMAAIQAAVTHQNTGNPWKRVIYTEDHDEDSNGRTRVPAEVDPKDPTSYYARKRSYLGAALTLTAPGIPMLFEGQELLMTSFFDPNGQVDWTLAQSQAPTLQLYKDLVALRLNARGKTKGLTGDNLNFFHVDETGKVVAYHRYGDGGPGDDVVVIVNCSNKTLANYRIGMPRSGAWQVRFNSDAKVYGSDFGDTATYVNAQSGGYDGLGSYADITIGPYTAVIVSQ